MKHAIYCLGWIMSLAACSSPEISPATSDDAFVQLRLENGVWFDGTGFTPRTFDIIDGKLGFTNGHEQVAATLDLKQAYVIPPLCEGHNHNLGDSLNDDEIRQTIETYLQSGIFYAMMQGSFDLYRDALINRINQPDSLDVVFASNGLTGSGGHPRGLREFLLERYNNYPEYTLETLSDVGYFEADSLEEVHEKMDLIISEQPDAIKVMLLFSEEYETRRNDPDYFGNRGLNPAFLPHVVQLAHEAGLRVSVHVESDADMATALRSGADIIAHLPSHDAPTRISDETITLAVETQAALITTLSLASRQQEESPEEFASIQDMQRENLIRLQVAGANLVIGSDSVRDVSTTEALYLEDLGALDNATLLSMWTENCSRMIFPDRLVGRLEVGYEASFIVLEDNPLENLGAVQTIRLRMKEGEWLESEISD